MVLQDGFGGLVACSGEEIAVRQHDHATGSPGSRVLAAVQNRAAAAMYAAGQCIPYLDPH